jgi:hypothetical protein
MTWPESSTQLPYPVAHTDAVWVPGDMAEGDYVRRNGYLQAARMLINTCDDGTGRHLLLPALNCYRHYFELQLKALAAAGRSIRTDAAKPKRSHELPELVADIHATLVQVAVLDGHTEQEAKALARRDLAELRAAVAALNELDPRGVVFRYAYDLADDAQLTPTVAEGFWLDLRVTISTLEAGAAVAEGADTHLDVWKSNYSDYLADMAALEANFAADYADAFGDYVPDDLSAWS